MYQSSLKELDDHLKVLFQTYLEPIKKTVVLESSDYNNIHSFS